MRNKNYQMRIKIIKLLFVLIFTNTCVTLVSGQVSLRSVSKSQQITAIKAGRLVNIEEGTISENQIILIEGARIKAVGTELAIPAGANVIDLSNQTVLPGLFDCHTHMASTVHRQGTEKGSIYFNSLTYTTAYRALEGVANLRSMLDTGFTTIRDVGNNGNYADVDLRRALEAGLIPGPTMITAGRIIAPYGGQFQLQPEKQSLGEPDYLYADSRDEMRKAIRQNIHYGSQVIKIVVDDQRYIYSTEDIKFIVAEARAAGLKVAAHAITAEGAKHAAEAGVASIEHGFDMPNDVLELAKKNNVVLVSTDFTVKVWLAYDMPEPLAKSLHANIVDRLKRAYKIGVKIAYGTDLMFEDPTETRGSWAMSLIESFQEAGIPPQDILKMMTINAAQLLGVENRRGLIKTGLAADIISVPQNPLNDIMALKKVDFVMKDGKVFRHNK